MTPSLLREIDAIWDKMDDREMLKVIGVPEEEIGTLSQQDIKSIRDELFAGKTLACYNNLTKKIIIFAENLYPKRAEEAFFHENIHAILHEWYGDKARNIADRFWDASPEEGGRVDKATIRKSYKSKEEKWAEEFFTRWLSQAMVDGRVQEVYDLLKNELADTQRLDNILNAIGYDREQETAERTATTENRRGVEAVRKGHEAERIRRVEGNQGALKHLSNLTDEELDAFMADSSDGGKPSLDSVEKFKEAESRKEKFKGQSSDDLYKSVITKEGEVSYEKAMELARRILSGETSTSGGVGTYRNGTKSLLGTAAEIVARRSVSDIQGTIRSKQGE